MGRLNWLSVSILVALAFCTSVSPGCTKRGTPAASAPNKHIQMLKSWVPTEKRKNIPSDFWGYDGFRDWWRFPLAYPYEIHVIDTLDNAGHLYRYDGKGDIKNPNQSTDHLVSGLTHITFDQNVLIARQAEDADFQTVESSAKCWIVFDFATGRFEEFPSEEAALKAAGKHGFKGDKALTSIKDQYNKCFE